jgi:hypothetical protein
MVYDMKTKKKLVIQLKYHIKHYLFLISFHYEYANDAIELPQFEI